MRYGLFVKETEKSLKIKEQLLSYLKNHILDDKNPEIVFCIGGDGTFLKAVNHYKNKLHKFFFVNINSGNLGFFSNFLISDFHDFDNIIKKEGYIEEYHNLLEFEIHYDNKVFKDVALNEVTITSMPFVQILDIYIDNVYLEEYRGAGVCICTTSGSTAYNKSLNGAVMDPKIHALQMTEIAPINSNRYKTLASPFILDRDRTIKISEKSLKTVVISYDNRYKNIKEFNYLDIKLSDKKVRFIRKKDVDFLTRIKKAFL